MENHQAPGSRLQRSSNHQAPRAPVLQFGIWDFSGAGSLGFGASARRFINHLVTRPVDLASLAAFRFLFGLLMAAAMVRFLARGWVRQLYLEPSFHFAYPGFEWIRPWPDALMYAHFVLLALLALGVALGFFYRICSTLFFLGFTYVELIDQTAYLNHYYLISLLSGLLMLLPAHQAWSLDVWRKPQLRRESVPAWCLNILRFQVAVVYIFAGLAKFNADWLFRAEPLRIWLAARSDLVLIGPWLQQLWVAYAASWFGALFDTTIVFFLLCRRTRGPAYALVIFFHVATWLLFNIGMFPWIMIVAATLLFPPDWPRLRLSRFGGALSRFSERTRSTPSHLIDYPAPSRLLRAALLLFVTVQLALPLRSYFASNPVAWTCHGFNCAWRVMVAEKTGYAEFYALDPATGKRRQLSPKNYLTPRQEIMMAQDPYLIRLMARRLAEDIRKSQSGPVHITATAYATMNGRPSQSMINPRANLAGEPSPGWILPLAH